MGEIKPIKTPKLAPPEFTASKISLEEASKIIDLKEQLEEPTDQGITIDLSPSEVSEGEEAKITAITATTTRAPATPSAAPHFNQDMRELENKLELLKKDSEALLVARENIILELKRKIDLLEFNFKSLEDKNELDLKKINLLQEKIAHLTKTLQEAIKIAENSEEG